MSVIKNKFKSMGRKLRRYAIGVFREIKRIRWPKGKDLVKATVTVAIFAVFFGICLFSFDYIVIKLLKAIGFIVESAPTTDVPMAAIINNLFIK